MIFADHKYWAELIFKPYIYRLLKNNFHSINLIGDLPEIPQELPLILIPNHSTWWDGFYVYLLNKKYFARKFYIMILEEQLAKYRFFTKLGGFSISRESPKSIIESLKYSADLLRSNPFSVTTIFPQGELLPNFTSPLIFNRGIEKIIRIYGENVCLLPLSIRPEYLKEEKASVFFKFGKPIIANPDTKDLTEILRTQVEQGLEDIANSLLNGNEGNIIMHGKISISDKSKKAFGIIKNA
jgi:1-acyl-sn-glycerol-3-phosphate acyltransferase